MTRYADLGDMEEDKRIDLIGHMAMDHRKEVGFVTETEPGKMDRYIRKLKERFPGISVGERRPGPIPDTWFVRVGPPVD